MQGVLSLQHFCETHGPQILMSTQAMHCTKSRPQSAAIAAGATGERLGAEEATGGEGGETTRTAVGTMEATAASGAATNTAIGTGNAGLGARGAGSATGGAESATGSQCAACGWTASVNGYTTMDPDPDSKLQFISRHYPPRPDVFALVRRACVRSLSSEMCPGRLNTEDG